MGDPQTTIIVLLILFGSIALHEFGHAKSADSAGDPTPRAYGRVTLNPVAHFDPIGAIMIIVLVLSGFGIGWGKPVPVNPARMRNPRWDGFMSVAWGPLTNVLLAVAFSLLFKFFAWPSQNELLILFCYFATRINILLALFNLLPIGPLDGHWLVSYMLPQPLGSRFALWSRSQGTFILFGIIILDQVVLREKWPPGILRSILFGPADAILSFLLGIAPG